MCEQHFEYMHFPGLYSPVKARPRHAYCERCGSEIQMPAEACPSCGNGLADVFGIRVSPRSVDIGAVVDAHNVHHQICLVQLVHDPVSAPTGGPKTGQLPPQGMAHPARLFEQWSEHEFDRGCGDLRGKAVK